MRVLILILRVGVRWSLVSLIVSVSFVAIAVALGLGGASIIRGWGRVLILVGSLWWFRLVNVVTLLVLIIALC